jgi:sarcosine oxidase subunit beta
MPDTADVVIVGAGIVGASIAFNLTAQGCRDVVLLEREPHQGLGSTGRSMGGVRAQFTTDVSIHMSRYSIPFYARFAAETGFPSEYRPHGYLFVASTARHVEYLRTNVARQQALGLREVRLVTRDEIVAMVPMIRSDDVLGGSYCPTDGFVDPYSVMTGYTQRALARGARLVKRAEVTAIDVEAGRVTGVRTSAGRIVTRTVVNAAGAWAAGVARMAGVDLPVAPQRRMLVPTEPLPGLPEKLPMTIDMATGFHFRPEANGLLMAWNDPEQTMGFDTEVDPRFVERILQQAVERFPFFADLPVNPARAWAGLYEMTPDHHGILGPSGVEGFYLANGFSGHGVMHAPATGRVLADVMLHGRCEAIPWEALRFDRFARGELIHEQALL